MTSSTQTFSGLSFPDSSSSQPVSTTLSDLKPVQAYEVRLVGDDGTQATEDTLTFETDDTSPPQTLTVDSPTNSTFRQSTATVDVTYSYTDATPATPDSVTITLDDGTNTASFGIDDSGYSGDDTQKTKTLDLASPKATTNSGIQAGSTYDVTVTATDDSSNARRLLRLLLVRKHALLAGAGRGGRSDVLLVGGRPSCAIELIPLDRLP